jgi:23S rRNA G2069 N7-methylase RlmK/C1962 C5-methylase RlmI
MVSHQSINYLLIFSFMLVNTAKSFLPLQARRSSFVSASSSPAFGLFSSIADEATEEQKQTKKTKLPMVILKRNRQSRSFRDGSQLVFSKSIDTVTDSVKVADLVLVNVPVSNDKENKNHQKIGVGVYNPNSMYRIRILSHSLMNAGLKFEGMEPSLALEMILTKSFQKALGIRRAMGFPSSYTDTYRLVNGEGDGISGLAVDVVGGEVAVIMSSAAWCQVHKATIMKCLQAVLPDHELVWKTTPSRLRQDGYILNADEEEADEVGDHLSPTIATENGIRYKTFPHVKGQKTSVYCDQRENRLNMAKLCEGKRVLDLCCYHGGFSLNAASHKATSVTGVDSSQDAIDISKENANLNDFDTRIEFVKADISSYMKACDEKYDVIVLDPRK